MENQTGRWRRLQRLHLRLLNLFARVFGLSAVAAATGFIAWAVYYFRHPNAATYDMVTLSGHASVDFLGAGIFCLLLAILFLTVRPYRRTSRAPAARTSSADSPGGPANRAKEELAGRESSNNRLERPAWLVRG